MGFFIYALAVWRLSHMLVREGGPGAAFAKLRELAGAHTRLLSCVSCTSVWAAGGLLLAPDWVRVLFAGSAVAKLVGDYFYGEAETVEAEGLRVAAEPLDSDWPPMYEFPSSSEGR